MNAATSAILWLSIQVFLFSLIGGAAYLLLLRRGPSAAVACAAMVLGFTLPIVLLMVSPWPRWIAKPESSSLTSQAIAKQNRSEDSNRSPQVAPETAAETPGASALILSWWQTMTGWLQGDENFAGMGRSAPTWQAWIPWILAAGIGIGLARLAAGIWAVGKLRHSSAPIEGSEVCAMWRQIAQQLKAPEIELRQSDLLRSAAIIGWRKPVLLLPAGWQSWTETERRVVLAHELAHVARRDYLTGLVARLASAIHFYQPLVLWLGRQLRIQQELAADTQAAAVAGGQQTYLGTLAQLALRADETPAPWAARAFLPGTSMLIKRVAWLKRSGLKVEKALSRKGRWILVFALAVLAFGLAGIRGPSGSLSPVVMAAPPDERQIETQKGGKAMDASQEASKTFRTFEYVPADAKLVIAFSPNEIAKLPAVVNLVSLFDRAGGFDKKFGLKVSEVSDVVVVKTTPAQQYERIILRTTKPHDWDTTLQKSVAGLESKTIGGKNYYLKTSTPEVKELILDAFLVVNDRTLIIGPESEIQKIIGGGEELMKASDFPEFQTKPFVMRAEMSILKAMAGLDKLPNDFEKNPAAAMFLPLIDHVKVEVGYAEMDTKVSESVGFHARLECDSAEGAQQVDKTLEALRTVGLNLLTAKIQAWRQGAPIHATAEQLLQINQFFEMVIKSLTGGVISAADKTVDVSINFDLNQAMVAGFLMPSVEASREAALRTQSMSNLRVLAIGMNMYYDRFKHFPPAAIRDKDGKPLLSWRVGILPFIEQNSLYKEFHLDEPWDSEHNKALIAKMPAVFRDPHEDAGSTNSSYFIPTGKGMFGGKEEGLNIRNISDGAQNTIMLVEAKQDIPWTKPDDIEIDSDASKPLPEFGGYLTTNNFLAAFVDGHVEVISKDIDTGTLHAMFTIAGGESIRMSPNVAVPPKPERKDSGASRQNVEFRIAESEPGEGLTEAELPGQAGQKIYLRPEVALTGADIKAVVIETRAEQPPKNRTLRIDLTDGAAKKMAELSKQNLFKRLAILNGGKVITAPRIQSEMSQEVQLTELFSEEEVKRLADGLHD